MVDSSLKNIFNRINSTIKIEMLLRKINLNENKLLDLSSAESCLRIFLSQTNRIKAATGDSQRTISQYEISSFSDRYLSRRITVEEDARKTTKFETMELI
jgi:hypothetical protein